MRAITFMALVLAAVFPISRALANDASDQTGLAQRAKTVMADREMDLSQAGQLLANYADSLRSVDIPLAAKCLERSGIAAFRSNQLDSALVRWQRGVNWARQAKVKKVESSLLNALAIGHTARGDIEAALPIYDRTIEIRLDLADTAGLARAWGNVATAYSNMGRIPEALEANARQEKWLQWVDNPTTLVGNSLRKAQNLSSMGRFEEALLQLQETGKLAQETGDPQAKGLIALEHGEVLLDLERPQEALPMLEKSLEIFQDSGDRYYSTFAEQSILICLMFLGQAEEVLTRSQSMIDEVTEAGQIPLLTVFKRLHGHALHELGRLEEAETLFAETLVLFEERREELGDEENRAAIFLSSGETYASLARCQLATDRPAEAFLTVERGRAPSFRQEIGSTFTTLEELQGQLKQINGALILFNDPQYDPLVAFVLDGDNLQVVELGPAGPLARDARAALRLLAAGEDLATCRPALARLGEELLQPILAISPATVDRFILVPPSCLAGFPLGMLPDDQGRAWEDQFGLSYLPNATSLLTLSGRPVPEEGWLAMADPVIPQAPVQHLPLSAARSQAGVALPEARVEVEQVSRPETRILVGRQASGNELRQALDHPLAVLHVATHAVVDPLDGGNSALVLAGPENLDQVSAREISDLKFQGDLVVLSGCSTFGSHRILGEGWFGLPRAFLTAGARSVISTLWDVDDLGASIFMREFYGALGRGENRDQALMAARKVCREKGMPPRDWAAFVLTGIGAEEVDILTEKDGHPWLWVLAIFLLAATTFLIYRAR